MLGTGIASADEDVNPDKAASPLDGALNIPLNVQPTWFATPPVNREVKVNPADIAGDLPEAALETRAPVIGVNRDAFRGNLITDDNLPPLDLPSDAIDLDYALPVPITPGAIDEITATAGDMMQAAGTDALAMDCAAGATLGGSQARCSGTGPARPGGTHQPDVTGSLLPAASAIAPVALPTLGDGLGAGGTIKQDNVVKAAASGVSPLDALSPAAGGPAAALGGLGLNGLMGSNGGSKPAAGGDSGSISGNLLDAPAGLLSGVLGNAVPAVGRNATGTVSRTSTGTAAGSLTGPDGSVAAGANLALFDVPAEVIADAMADASTVGKLGLDEPEPVAHLAVNSETMGGLPITGVPKLPALTQGLGTASPVPELGQSGPVSDLVGWLGGSLPIIGELAGGLPVGELTGGLPIGELAGGLPLGDLTGGLPIGELAGALPLSGLAGGLPVGELTGGVPVGELTGGVPADDLVARREVGAVPDAGTFTGTLPGIVEDVSRLADGAAAGIPGMYLPALPAVFGALHALQGAVPGTQSVRSTFDTGPMYPDQDTSLADTQSLLDGLFTHHPVG